MRLVTVVGARPQFVKAAVVSRALRARHGVTEVLVHTGQHYDENMSDVFFRELDIPRPDHTLHVGSLSHGAQTGRMLEQVERLLRQEAPDVVLVYGDTNTTLAAALAAAKLHVPVAHVEAGLRSFNRRMPEEINRQLTDHLSELLLAPTQTAVDNLRREGLPEARIHLVGDVMYDAALFYGAKADRSSSALRTYGLEAGRYVLATVHRAENTDDPARLRAVVEGLADVAAAMPVLVPLHPRTSGALQSAGVAPELLRRLQIVPPLGYLDMTLLERNAALVATDSGGVQKEAFFHGVPCVTLRDETEWTELVELGWNRLVPPRSPSAVADGLRAALAGGPGRAAQPYGAGDAADAIVDRLLAHADGGASRADAVAEMLLA